MLGVSARGNIAFATFVFLGDKDTVLLLVKKLFLPHNLAVDSPIVPFLLENMLKSSSNLKTPDLGKIISSNRMNRFPTLDIKYLEVDSAPLRSVYSN